MQPFRYPFLSLIFVLTSAAQVVPDQYIVQLSTEPAARLMNAEAHRFGVKSRLAQSEAALITARRQAIATEQDGVGAAIEARGAKVLRRIDTVGNMLIVVAPGLSQSDLAAIPGVVRVYQNHKRKPLLDRALPYIKVPDAWTQIGGMSNAGAGVKIGVIDTGIDTTHPAFQDSSLQMPQGFPKVTYSADSVYTNNKVIVAREYNGSITDDYGHGTAVAMCAAGVTNTGPFGTITGVAPKAWLGNYNASDGSGSFADSDLIRALNDAVTDGMDIINMSLGGAPAPRPIDDPLVAAVQNAIFAGKVVTIAAGNDGSIPNSVGSPGTSPDAITVGSVNNDRIFADFVLPAGATTPYIGLPGDGNYSSTPTVNAQVVDITSLDSTSLACNPLPNGSLSGKIALVLRGTCFFEMKANIVQAAGATAMIVYTDPARPTAIPMAMGAATLPSIMLSNPDGVALKALVAARPGLTALVGFVPQPFLVSGGSLSDFSSRGPSSDFSIKPEMLSIGGSVSTAYPTAQGSYAVLDGTSFSTPITAGEAALVLGARPGLTNAQYKSLLVNSTTQMTDANGNPMAINLTGAGLANALNALNLTATAVPSTINYGTGDVNFDMTKNITITNVGSASDTFNITVAPYGGNAPTVSKSSVQLAPGASQTITVELAGSGVTPGAYQGFVLIQGSQASVATRVPYWYATPTGTPAYFQAYYPTDSVSAGSQQFIYFRFLDPNGIPVSGTPTITASGVGCTVGNTVSDDFDAPGLSQTTVRVGRSSSCVYTFVLNGVTGTVTLLIG